MDVGWQHKGIFTHVEDVFHEPPLNSHRKACTGPRDEEKASVELSSVINKNFKIFGEEHQILSLSGHQEMPIMSMGREMQRNLFLWGNVSKELSTVSFL